MATQYDPIAKDESLNTTELTPRNIADVLAEELANIVTALGGGSLEDLNDVAIVTPSNGQTLKYNSTTQKWENANDAGGHTIYDPDETAMTQRAGLGFTDAHVSDNSGDDRTDISLVEAISKTDWDNLDPTDPSNNGLYEINDPNNSPILTASEVGYGTETVKDALDGVSPILRAKNWGSITSLAEIETFLNDHDVASGKFTDLAVGDYLTIGGYTCYIAGFDTEYNKGDTALSDHHISFIANFGKSKMNTSVTTSGGYEGASTMQSFLSTKAGELDDIVSTHLKSRQCRTSTSTSGGKSNAWGWNAHKLTLLTDIQVFGSLMIGNYFDVGEGYEKLPIFNKTHPVKLFGRNTMWLRGVESSSNYCSISEYGYANGNGAANELTTVALFVIG